jgi:phage terminase small subunit
MTGLSVKQEKFCKKFLECGDASNAYRFAYNAEGMKQNTVGRKAHELKNHPKVAAKLRLMQEKQQIKHEITLETVTSDLLEARELARTLKKPEPMISATAHIARIHGIGTDDPTLRPLTNINLNFTDDMLYSMLNRYADKKQRQTPQIEGKKDGVS